MKVLVRIMMMFVLAGFLAGCHTTRTLTKVGTGHVGLGDVWDSVLADEVRFKDNYW